MWSGYGNVWKGTSYVSSEYIGNDKNDVGPFCNDILNDTILDGADKRLLFAGDIHLQMILWWHDDAIQLVGQYWNWNEGNDRLFDNFFW